MGQAKQRGTFEQRVAQAQSKPLGGKIDVLNTGLGHNEIHIDGSNVIELERASRIIKDMLKRGYALFVHGKENELVRVKRFDEKHKVYIIGAEATLSPEVETVTQPVLNKHGKKTDDKAVPVGSAKVTSVGRSAGG
jgi:hypothetical protein